MEGQKLTPHIERISVVIENEHVKAVLSFRLVLLLFLHCAYCKQSSSLLFLEIPSNILKYMVVHGW